LFDPLLLSKKTLINNGHLHNLNYTLTSYDEAEYDILQYIKYYNGERCHSYNNYLTPINAEAIAA